MVEFPCFQGAVIYPNLQRTEAQLGVHFAAAVRYDFEGRLL